MAAPANLALLLLLAALVSARTAATAPTFPPASLGGSSAPAPLPPSGVTDSGTIASASSAPPPAKCCPEGRFVGWDNATGAVCGPAAPSPEEPSGEPLCAGDPWRLELNMSDRGRDFDLDEDGALLLLRLDAQGPRPPRLGRDEFCADWLSDGSGELVIACVCQKVRCVKKCCFSNETFVVPLRGDAKCLPAGAPRAGAEPWQPPPSAVEPGPRVRVLPGEPFCADGGGWAVLNVYPDHPARRFAVLADGSLRLGEGDGPSVGAGAFCLDTSRLHDGSLVANALYCAGGAGGAGGGGGGDGDAFYASLLVVGALFLVLTLGAYALVPEVGRKPHARALMCHCGAMLLAFATLVPLQLGALPLGGAACYAAVLLVQFGMLASFFWLNVLCIDIAWAFRELQSPSGERRPRRRRLVLGYSAYAWGGAAAAAGATAAMDAATHRLPPSVPRPNIAVTQCWFDGSAATLLYYYGPMAVLLLANAVLFVYTAVLLGSELRRRKQLQAADSRFHGADALSSNRDRLAVYLKLFCLMGVVWVTEIISWAEGSRSAVWMVTDAVNALRGLGVFALFCCNRRVLRKLRERLACGGGGGGSACCARAGATAAAAPADNSCCSAAMRPGTPSTDEVPVSSALNSGTAVKARRVY